MMARFRQWGMLAMLLGGAAIASTPAAALEIFGIRLWGEADDDAIEIIDPLPYTVEFQAAAAANGLERRLRNASALWRDRDTPASGKAGLLAKAKGDYRRILAALYDAGYYGGTISIELAGREAAELSLAADLPAEVPVAIRVDPGPGFEFGVTQIINRAPDVPGWPGTADSPEDVGFEAGAPAEAEAVSRASALEVAQWRRLSYAKAEEADRSVVADHATNRLDVTLRFAPGAPARYGPVTVSGSRRVDPEFIEFMTDLEDGERFDPDEIDAAQARLAQLGVFRAIRVEEGETIGPDGRLPIGVFVEDRRPRTLGFGGTISTIDGIGLDAYWVHRNLFGRAERLRFDAGVARIGQYSDVGELAYNAGVSFAKPGVYTPDTTFVASLEARQLNYDTYDERSITGRVGLTQTFAGDLTGYLFFDVAKARIEDDLGVRDFLTLGPLARAEYERRDDPLEPTSGFWLGAEAFPFYEAEFGNVVGRATVEGRIYRGFGADDRFVLAGRALVGSLAGAPVEEVPPDQLFFAGGGGSVRGYEYRSIGVQPFDVAGEEVVIGGRGLVEATGELRVRLTERFGGVGFVDAGFVTADPGLGGDTDLRLGAGLGLRYYTGIGAIRVDVARALDPRPDDPPVALYIGIGQTF